MFSNVAGAVLFPHRVGFFFSTRIAPVPDLVKDTVLRGQYADAQIRSMDPAVSALIELRFERGLFTTIPWMVSLLLCFQADIYHNSPISFHSP